jgi:hypothetical protein
LEKLLVEISKAACELNSRWRQLADETRASFRERRSDISAFLFRRDSLALPSAAIGGRILRMDPFAVPD